MLVCGTRKLPVSTKKKDEVSRLLQEADKACSGVEKIGQELSQSGRLARDVIDCVGKVVNSVEEDSDLSPDEWGRLKSPLEGLHNQAVRVQQFDYRAFTSTASGTGLSMVTVIGQLNRPGPAPFQYAVKSAVSGVYAIFARQDLLSEIVQRLAQLGLERRYGNKQTAIEQLQDAKAAIEGPTHGEGVPVAILIPLRECIQNLLEELLRRRRKQEAARGFKTKILSIMNQCGRAGLAQDHFLRLAEDGYELIDRLSGGKDQAMSRAELSNLFQKGMLFLKAILDSIEETKLRMP